MSKANRFGTGGCFTCRSCSRKTRDTGRGDNEGCQLCVECFELSGIENEISDNGPSEERVRNLSYWLAEVIKKGGVLKGVDNTENDIVGEQLKAIDNACKPLSRHTLAAFKKFSQVRCELAYSQYANGANIDDVALNLFSRNAKNATLAVDAGKEIAYCKQKLTAANYALEQAYDKHMVDIARRALATAIDQEFNYENLDAAVEAYATNARDTAREQGLPSEFQMQVESLTHKYYLNHKADMQITLKEVLKLVSFKKVDGQWEVEKLIAVPFKMHH